MKLQLHLQVYHNDAINYMSYSTRYIITRFPVCLEGEWVGGSVIYPPSKPETFTV